MEPATSTSHRLEYLGLRALRTAVRVLPERMALGTGAALGRLAGALGVRRDQVRGNLELAFPDSDEDWRKRIERETFAHLGSEMVMLLRLAQRKPSDLREFVLSRTSLMDAESTRVFDRIKADSDEGRGSIMITGHLGNWELAGAAMAARGIPLDAVAVRQKNPLVDTDLRRQREAFGMRVIDRDTSPRAVPEALRTGRVVALVADQHVAGGLPILFFGHPALTPKGPAVFARRVGVPIVVAGAVVRGTHPRSYQVFLQEVPAVPTEDRKDAQILGTTRMFTEALEGRIRQDPGQYMWLHRRWRPSALKGQDPTLAAIP